MDKKNKTKDMKGKAEEGLVWKKYRMSDLIM